MSLIATLIGWAMKLPQSPDPTSRRFMRHLRAPRSKSKCQLGVAPTWRFEVAPGGPSGKLLRSWAV